VRRLVLLVAGGAVWLLLAAGTASADGGPHVLIQNDGSSGISADNCAGCHRAHTAQAPLLLVQEEPALCLTCHGSTGVGATTDVQNGIQYALGSSTIRGQAVLGALRNGGFVEARIDSGQVGRLTYVRNAAGDVSFRSKVPVRDAGQAVTSTHIDITDITSGVAWGNGPISATANAGGAMTLDCTSCHNPHGNGQYRILRPIPGPQPPSTTDAFIEATVDAPVDDAPLPPVGDTRNYTVIQTLGTEGTNATYLLYASQVVSGGYSATAGDYFHRTVPWDPQVNPLVAPPAGVTANDAPNGKPSTFNTQITNWCTACHTRYLGVATGGVQSWRYDSGDAIFRYKHMTTTNRACTTCHVSHGSNAQMTGFNSSTMTYPGGAAAPVGDSRLLKIDNRGTCQACHDPTETRAAGTFDGPLPAPYVP